MDLLKLLVSNIELLLHKILTVVSNMMFLFLPTHPVESLVWVADLSNGCNNIPETGVPIGLPVSNGIAYGVKITDGEQDPIVIAAIIDGSATPATVLAKRGEPCELWMGGEAVARGYHERPELNRTKFVKDPFEGEGRMYATGDLVIFPETPGDPIQFIGRVDTQVKIRGKRLELGEVETYLSLFPAVNDCKVLFKTRDGSGHLAVYVLWEEDALKEKPVSELEK